MTSGSVAIVTKITIFSYADTDILQIKFEILLVFWLHCLITIVQSQAFSQRPA